MRLQCILPVYLGTYIVDGLHHKTTGKAPRMMSPLLLLFLPDGDCESYSCWASGIRETHSETVYYYGGWC